MDTPRAVVRELSEVGRVGCLTLTFARGRERTILRDCFSEIPHKITRPYYAPGSATPQLILMNSTAGLFGGDRTEIEIRVERGAQAIVRTQASTKVHPGPGLAEQHIRLIVEAEAELHYHSDPLIPFAGSRLKQQVEIQVCEGSRLYFWDAFVAGRVEHGEAWQFRELSMETRLTRDGRPIYLDRFRLEPAVSSPAAPWAMNDFRYHATGLLINESISLDVLRAAAPEAGIDQPAERLTAIRGLVKNGVQYRELEKRIGDSVSFSCRRGL